MWIVGVIASLALIFLTLMDGFEVVLLPRRVTRRYRYVRIFYRSIWRVWRIVALRIRTGRLRETFLSIFGPLSLLLLFTTWVAGLIIGFGLLHWSLATVVNAPEGPAGLSTYLYLSGTTFFTLGYGDVTPVSSLGRILAVIESGMGFGFLAVIISYLPVLYQAFSHREVMISLLDARTGSPPSAGQCLLRLARSAHMTSAEPFLAEWERWASEVLESHLTFPLLCYYRSQHDNQSWLAALTAVLDTCAVLIAGVKGNGTYQAQLTFAMARHAVVDLCLVFKIQPRPPESDRMSGVQLQRLRSILVDAGLDVREEAELGAKLAELRGMYEPFANALATRFLFALPSIMRDGDVADNWQTSAWMPRTPGIGDLPKAGTGDEHFR